MVLIILLKKKLKIFTDKGLIHYLNNEEEKKEFILSFCQNSLNYQETLEVCLYFLKKNESEKINIVAFDGLAYILFRFRKIDFKTVLPFIRKYLSYSMMRTRMSEWMAARYLLANIVIMIPKLRVKIIPLLKKHCAVYLETPSFIEYIMTKNKQKDQLKLEKMLKLYLNNFERKKIKYNLNF
ncbi:MAG: hypothetical protein LN560_03265 [Rickettsia endosymbiont of Sceptobius lativentris]|nr:hypothetical protein [Rickettsia endosymbiont of Sceptobius lativentris]